MTLLEVLIALALATVGLLGALAMVGASMQGGAFAKNISEASVLAQSKIESLVIMPGVTMTSPISNVPTVEPSSGQTGLLDQYGNVVSNGTYTRTTTWGLSTDGLRRTITVDVSWNDALGTTHHVYAQRERAP